MATRIRIEIDLTLDGEYIDLSHDVSVKKKNTKTKSRKRSIKKASNKAKATAAPKEKKKKRVTKECVVCYKKITKTNFIDICSNSNAEHPHLVCTSCLGRICKDRNYPQDKRCPICRFQYSRLAIERFRNKQIQLKLAKKEAAAKKAKEAGKSICGVCSRTINAKNFWDVCVKNCIVCKFCVKRIDRTGIFEYDMCCPMCDSQYPRGVISHHKNRERLEKQRRNCRVE